MKRVLAMVAAMVLAMAFVGCSSGSLLVESDDEGVHVTAEGGVSDASATGDIDLKAGQGISINPALTKGSVSIKIVDETGATINVDEVSGSDPVQVPDATGSCDMLVTANGAEGTVEIVAYDVEAAAEGSSAAASTAGSTSAATGAIKDDPEEAERQLAIAMKYLLEDAYGDKVNDFRITSTKFFTAEEEQADETLADYNLGPDEVAFSVEYELRPAEGVDANELTAATGQYDEASGWVTDKGNIGILRPNPDGDEPAYVITDFGTGF